MAIEALNAVLVRMAGSFLLEADADFLAVTTDALTGD